MKRTEYKFKLAKFTIGITAFCLTEIALIWIVIHSDVQTMDATINVKEMTVEIGCDFAN